MKWVDNQKRNNLSEAFKKQKPGQAIVLQKGSDYPYPFPVKFPELIQKELSEEGRIRLNRDFLERIRIKIPEEQTDTEKLGEDKTDSNEDKVEQLVRLCADKEYCFKGNMDKFLALGIRGKDEQESILRKAIDHGYIKKNIAKAVTGNKGAKISLLEITDYACSKFNLKYPVRQNESITAQYYCKRIFEAIKTFSSDYIVEVQGTIVNKKVDVLLTQKSTNHFISIEVACSPQHEAFNLMADLISNPEIVKKHIIICETDLILKTVKKDIKKVPDIKNFKDIIHICKFSQFINNISFYLNSEGGGNEKI